MSNFPDFDFSSYNPKDPWQFPPQRLIRFAFEARAIFLPSRDKWVRIRPFPDVRYVVFHELVSDCYALGCFGMLCRAHGQDAEWWQAQPEMPDGFPKNALAASQMNLRGLLQFGFFQRVAKQLDSTFRQILRSLDPEARENAGVGFSKVWRALLKQTGQEDYADLIRLILLLRDSLGHSGKFCPVNRKNKTLRYGGKEFLFVNNADLDAEAWGFIDVWDCMLYLLRELDGMLNAVFESPFVALLPHVRARHLEG